ncbi:uncharacterized protein H6S33_001893 [Morchella sextelata]|uniref:uncharacterized protein n=1 Tax=Morchella sextelata TaxID=1174677 RepID=UPI001D036EC9|nr:uncharacterized protein H6S33_001893 [Morchella sextelata]KAH0608759.1 hypothetical protein H6S33_001893 [Morchella sextelata]
MPRRAEAEDLPHRKAVQSQLDILELILSDTLLSRTRYADATFSYQNAFAIPDFDLLGPDGNRQESEPLFLQNQNLLWLDLA